MPESEMPDDLHKELHDSLYPKKRRPRRDPNRWVRIVFEMEEPLIVDPDVFDLPLMERFAKFEEATEDDINYFAQTVAYGDYDEDGHESPELTCAAMIFQPRRIRWTVEEFEAPASTGDGPGDG